MNSMTTYVALLRGINVGGNKKVSMTKLKTIFETLGFVNVTTYINSGNVLFQSSKKDFSMIEPALKRAFGFAIAVTVRDTKNIHMLCQKIPNTFTNDTEQKTDVLFLWDAFDSKKTLKDIKINPTVDILHYFPGAIVWNIKRSNYAKSGMKTFIGTTVYKNMTARNINTVRKLDIFLRAK